MKTEARFELWTDQTNQLEKRDWDWEGQYKQIIPSFEFPIILMFLETLNRNGGGGDVNSSPRQTRVTSDKSHRGHKHNWVNEVGLYVIEPVGKGEWEEWNRYCLLDRGRSLWRI